MQILLIVKISTFISNATSTSMKYSKISGMRNLDTTRTSTWRRKRIQDLCHCFTRCGRCLLRIRKLVFQKLRKFQLSNILKIF